MTIIDALLKTGDGKKLKLLSAVADHVLSYGPDMENKATVDLRELTESYRARLAGGQSPDDLLPEAFAVVRESSRRTLGKPHYRVQLVGGAALHLGNIAEMGTGEGKTLVALLPAYLNALSGVGVHVVTVNDYLAVRDAGTARSVLGPLGVTVGVVVAASTSQERQDAYRCDITYGTSSEFGFDYLRDNTAMEPEEVVQRGHHFALVDEVDSVLIDEARTPLIISGPEPGDVAWYRQFAKLAAGMVPDEHYTVNEADKQVGILPDGLALVEHSLGAKGFYSSDNVALAGMLHQALKAQALFHKDTDYIVSDRQIVIVDEHTGRPGPGRRFGDGLHQAIEAKEGLQILPKYRNLASITVQNYFRQYRTLCGMSGTASSEAVEFHETFNLGVVTVPPNRPSARRDLVDVIYRTRAGKYAAVVRDIAARHRNGQPVLVGTADVTSSEELSAMLTAAGIAHNTLNAKQPGREAEVVAAAGVSGAVTVATNMAGRGTDIALGGPDDTRTDTARAAAVAAGGLCVIGTERHPSRRIDDQLRGRAGRQGDPGTTVFYLSLEDDLVRNFAGGRAMSKVAATLGDDTRPLPLGMVSKAVAQAQVQVENRHRQARGQIVKYDDVLMAQRKVVYQDRDRILHDPEPSRLLTEIATSAVSHTVEQWGGEGGIIRLVELLSTYVCLGDDVEKAASGALVDGPDALRDLMVSRVCSAIADRTGRAADREAHARTLMLRVFDAAWRRQVDTAAYIQAGVHLRSSAQEDPLVEYQQDASDLFIAMGVRLRRDITGYACHVDPLPVARSDNGGN